MMKSTREQVLQTLLNHPRCTIQDLAEAVDINAISVRHHLTNLQLEGVVTATEERHGVGRPRLVYSLTAKGMERFPTRYFQLTNRLLDEMKKTLPEATIQQLFTRMAHEQAIETAKKVCHLPLEQRIDALRQLLQHEGFTMEWEKRDNEYFIHEITCPYFHVGQHHPEVCAIDENLISTVVGLPALKVNCALQGDACCSFKIQAEGK